MQHLILGFFFFALLLGACAAVLTILLYLRYRQSFFLYLSAWALVSLCYAVAESLLLYSGVTTTDIERSVRYVYFSFSFVAGGVLLYVVPRLSHLAVNAALSRSARSVHVTLLGTYWAATAVILLLRELDLYMAVSDLAVGAAAIYGMLLLSLRGRSVRSAEIRSVIRSALICGYVTVPLILLQRVLSASGLVSGPLVDLPVPKFALMAWLSMLILYYSSRFFFVSSSAVDILIAEASLRDYRLTAREREVVEELLHGYTSKAVAQRLGISEKTAKNHIYAIYQKIGVKSRLELYNMLSRPDRRP